MMVNRNNARPNGAINVIAQGSQFTSIESSSLSPQRPRQSEAAPNDLLTGDTFMNTHAEGGSHNAYYPSQECIMPSIDEEQFNSVDSRNLQDPPPMPMSTEQRPTEEDDFNYTIRLNGGGNNPANSKHIPQIKR